MTEAARIALFAALALCGALLLFWPASGVLPRVRSRRRLKGRTILEDALKAIFEENERRGHASLRSLAGAVSLREDDATRIVTRMESSGLLLISGDGLRLTGAGREYALQVIRAHRLWERFLADRTGVAAASWHARAERREHALTPDETAALAARLGHPHFDPHGDPIPTAEGDLPRQPLVSLCDLAPGVRARIVHIEDEPAAVYARIEAAGLHAGMEIQVEAVLPDGVLLRGEGEQRKLAALLAAQVGVVPLASDAAEEAAGRSERLSHLRPGERAEVRFISRACRGLERRRLMDLGIVPGTVVEALMRSPSGDPTAYRVRGTTIAIRRRQADDIRVRRVAELKERTG